MTEEKLVALLQKSVATPSVNPDHTDDPSIANEFRMADVFADELMQRGFEIEWDRTITDRPNVIATFGPGQPRHTLLFESHLDTVGIRDMIIPPFEPTVKNGRLYGRGACDTKGPMAATLGALEPERLDRLAAAGVRIIFVGAMGEEHGNIGAENLVARGLGADTAIILEPTDLSIVYAHKGVLWLEATLTGTAAHGSTPEKGLNAISAMSQLITDLEKQHAQVARQKTLPDMGAPTLNLGRIHGGGAVNIVAQQCRVELDYRILPNQNQDTVIADIKQRMASLVAEGRIRSGEVRLIKGGAPFRTDTHAPLVQRMQQSIATAGVEPRLTTAGWYSDAGAFSKTCPEIIVFGPGSIHQAHTEDEFIEIAELVKGQAVLADYLDRLAQGDWTEGAH